MKHSFPRQGIIDRENLHEKAVRLLSAKERYLEIKEKGDAASDKEIIEAMRIVIATGEIPR